MPITILDLALHRGAKKNEDGSINGGAIEDVGLPLMGGCLICGASIAAYNACPSKSGYLKCGASSALGPSDRCASGCIDEDGFSTVEEANASLFEIGP